MKRVLFVDDEPNVLRGLRRMMHSLRNEWEMYFVESGQKALDLLSSNRFDVIVSDMKMPVMNGAELLSIVREKYPHMIRIILSGYSDQDLLLKTVRPAHQFLTKPCDAQRIKTTVQRASKTQSVLASLNVKKVITGIDSLPSLPALYNEIVQKLHQDNISAKEIAGIIQKDMGMTTQILKLVNSSFFGFFKKISNPVQAVSLLGLDTIKTLVLSHKIFSALKFDRKDLVSFEQLWEHSTLTAVFSRHIARSIDKNDKAFIEDAFMTGFLHDIGILILASKLTEEYEKVLKHTLNSDQELWKTEYELMGTSHAEIGAYLLSLWGFSENIIEAILYHHQVKIFGDEPKSLIFVVHLADAFSLHLNPALNKKGLARLNQNYLKALDLYDKAKIWYNECKKIFEEGAIQ